MANAGSKPSPSPVQFRSPIPLYASSFFGEDASVMIIDLACSSKEADNPSMTSSTIGVHSVKANLLSNLPFTRHSVGESNPSSSAKASEQVTGSTGKSGSTGSSTADVQPNSSSASRPIESSEQGLIPRPISKVTVAANTTPLAGLSPINSCATLRDAAKSSGTTALLAGTTARYAAATNAIGKHSLATTPASNGDPIRSVQFNLGVVGHTNFKVLGGSTTVLLAGTTALQAGTTAVCADFPLSNNPTDTGNQSALVPANNNSFNQSIQGKQSSETITVGNFPCWSTTAVTQCSRAGSTACCSVPGTALASNDSPSSLIGSGTTNTESKQDSVSELSDSIYGNSCKTKESVPKRDALSEVTAEAGLRLLGTRVCRVGVELLQVRAQVARIRCVAERGAFRETSQLLVVIGLVYDTEAHQLHRHQRQWKRRKKRYLRGDAICSSRRSNATRHVALLALRTRSS